MVTQTQVKSGLPLSQGLDALAAALAQLTNANGTNSILGFDVKLGDANLNPQGAITITIPLSIQQAATMFTTMITTLQTLQAAYQQQLTAL